MKLPFDLGVKLFFRLLFPGFLLALGGLPALRFALKGLGAEGSLEVAFVLAVIAGGWLVVAADMPIYMLVEGRRFWPRPVRVIGLRLEERRLRRINACIDAYYAAGGPDTLRRSWLEASVEKRSFPLGPTGERMVTYPTKLGNGIASYEQYGNTRYGVETVFYWPRIWIHLDKDLREELDGRQALVDSAVYACVTASAASVLWVSYCGVSVVVSPQVIFLPSGLWCLAAAALFASFGRLAYGAATYASAQYGDLFMAVLDSHVHRLTDYVNIQGISSAIADQSEQGTRPEGDAVGRLDDQEALETARRYLQYFTVRLPGVTRAVPFPAVAERPPPLRGPRRKEEDLPSAGGDA